MPKARANCSNAVALDSFPEALEPNIVKWLQGFFAENLDAEAMEKLAFSRWWALREPEFERNTPLNKDIVRASSRAVKVLQLAERALKHFRDVAQERLETSRTNSTEGRAGAESMLFRAACDEFKKLSPYNHGLEFLEFHIRDACEAFRQAPSSLVGKAQRGRDREHPVEKRLIWALADFFLSTTGREPSVYHSKPSGCVKGPELEFFTQGLALLRGDKPTPNECSLHERIRKELDRWKASKKEQAKAARDPEAVTH